MNLIVPNISLIREYSLKRERTHIVDLVIDVENLFEESTLKALQLIDKNIYQLSTLMNIFIDNCEIEYLYTYDELKVQDSEVSLISGKGVASLDNVIVKANLILNGRADISNSRLGQIEVRTLCADNMEANSIIANKATLDNCRIGKIFAESAIANFENRSFNEIKYMGNVKLKNSLIGVAICTNLLLKNCKVCQATARSVKIVHSEVDILIVGNELKTFNSKINKIIVKIPLNEFEKQLWNLILQKKAALQYSNGEYRLTFGEELKLMVQLNDIKIYGKEIIEMDDALKVDGCIIPLFCSSKNMNNINEYIKIKPSLKLVDCIVQEIIFEGDAAFKIKNSSYPKITNLSNQNYCLDKKSETKYSFSYLWPDSSVGRAED